MRSFSLLISGIILLTLTACQKQETGTTEEPSLNICSRHKTGKLLFCAGNPDTAELAKKYPGETYNENNQDWFTVDNDPTMNPDYLADLEREETYKHLSRNPYEIIVDEFCPGSVTDKIHTHAPELLKKDGILVSKVCAPFQDLKKIKENMMRQGYSKVIIGNPEFKDPYWQKKASPTRILEIFQQNEVKSPSENVCYLPDSQWYNFVAVK